MRVLVTGSRDWSDKHTVFDALEKAFEQSEGLMTVVHGSCPTGADSQAAEWVTGRNLIGYLIEEEAHPAEWDGPAKRGAGFARNAEMVALGADLCLAFIRNESNGATHTKELAEKAGIPTRIFRSTAMPNDVVKRVQDELKLEDIRMIWRNFAGEEKQFNAQGQRNFAIPLEAEQAHKLIEIGWNVKAKEKDGEMLYHLPVKVKFGVNPPRLFMITKSKNRRTKLDEETVMLLDYAEFDLVDVILRPYNWDVQGKQGVTAYLKTGFFTIHEDDLEKKYAHIPDEVDGPLAIENVIDAEVVSEEEDDDPWAEEPQDSRRAITRGNK